MLHWAYSMIQESGVRLIPSGYGTPCSDGEIVLFVNAGSMTPAEGASYYTADRFMADSFFEGGDTIQTEDFIAGGKCYQSARLGNFCYRFDNLEKGNYFVDLYFSEFIIDGPEGMRVFNVFVQDEKTLSNLDIFAIVRFKRGLQVIGARAVVKDDGVLVLRFEGVVGNPVVCGISVRKAPKRSVSQPPSHIMCSNCYTQIEYHSAQKKVARTKSDAEYKKDIQDLSDSQKSDEWYEVWKPQSAADEELQKVRMDLETLQTYSLEKSWTEAINNLEQKVKIMKRDHAELSRAAREFADSIPDSNQMVSAVQSLVEQREDLKFKYNEEQAKVANLSEKLKVKEESSNKLQQKVNNDLENKLRDEKIKELKRKMKEIKERLSLHQKIKELEEKVREQEQRP